MEIFGCAQKNDERERVNVMLGIKLRKEKNDFCVTCRKKIEGKEDEHARVGHEVTTKKQFMKLYGPDYTNRCENEAHRNLRKM